MEPMIHNAGSYLVFDAGNGRQVALATIDGTATVEAHRIVDAVLHRLAELRGGIEAPGPAADAERATMEGR
jgi:hypothetical protein